jgi:hypothetical protein
MPIVHYRYMLGITIALLIVVLSVKWRSIPEIASLLSFALTFSSLVLAIIAIIQALLSNSAFARIIGSVTSSLDQVKIADIQQASTQLVSHTEAIPSALGEMSQRLDQALNRPSTAGPIEAGEAEQPIPAIHADTPAIEATAPIIQRNTHGTLIAYYICILSYEREQAANPREIFVNTSTGFYVQGCIARSKDY